MILTDSQAQGVYREKSVIGMDGFGVAVPPMFVWRYMCSTPVPVRCEDPFLHVNPDNTLK
ncbi:MAG: hypothetical protein ABSD81_01970 [Methanomicrobiales archaeon]